MKRIAIFPGSFDPFTKGHENVIEKVIGLFDEIIISIGQNSTKKNYFSLESKIKHIESLYKNEAKISVSTYSGLTSVWADQHEARYLIRGLRDCKDFEFERSIAQMNAELDTRLETVFIITHQNVNHINSTVVREIHKNGGIIDSFVTNSQFLVSEL